MEVSRIRALRGPNLWSRHTAIEVIVSCTTAECDIDNINGFESGLRERFPAIGLLQIAGRNEPVSMAHVLEVASLALVQSHSAEQRQPWSLVSIRWYLNIVRKK